MSNTQPLFGVDTSESHTLFDPLKLESHFQKIRRLAFEIPAPNKITPEIVMAANSAEGYQNELLEALKICRREIAAAQNNMIANGYKKNAMSLKMLSYASLQAADAIAKAHGGQS